MTPWNYEGRVLHRGKVVWFHGMSIPTRYHDRTVFDGILLNITERKLAEEKSRESEEKFHKIFMTNPNSIGIARLSDGLLLDANKRFEDVLGWKREDVVGTKSVDWPHSFWVDFSERDFMVKELKAGRDVQFREFKFRRSDGKIRVGIYSSRSINIDNEECLIFILQDITDRKLAEEKFRKIYMTTPNCIAITRLRDGLITDINKGFEDMLGWRREEVIGTTSTELPMNFWVNLSDRELMVKDLKAGRDILHREFEFRRSDGSIRRGIYSSRPINIEGEECLIFILQDVTELMLAEEKFRKIFMTTPDCIGITRLKDGLIIEGNNGFKDIIGWDIKEVIGTRSTEAPMNFWVDLLARDFMVAEIEAGRDVLRCEFEFRRKDGSIRDGVYSARPVDIGGEACLIFILQDITEQKRMETKLLESQKTSLMSRIASGVAHEVRNPLHAIQAISEAMAVDLDEKSDYKDYLMHIKSQVGRLSHLMNDLLDLGKPIQPSQFSEARVHEIVAASLRYWVEAHPRQSQQVKIVSELLPDDPVLVDASKIQQVIINLIDNAVQHSPKDEKILLQIGQAGENDLMIKIIDRGEGLQAQDQHRIYEPFYTTRKSGTGLGLSLCKHIIESHGGRIEIINNKDAPGCTAQFTLPVYHSKEHI